MNAYADEGFWADYARLPIQVQRLTDVCFARGQGNPFHPGLRFKSIEGKPGWWSARVGIDHRTVCVRVGNDCNWFFIGTHAEYDLLLR